MSRTSAPGHRPDGTLGAGVCLFLLGAPAAWFGWMGRPATGAPWLAIAGAAAATLGGILAVLRARGMDARRLVEEAEADRNPLSAWEARHPLAAPLAVAIAAAAALVFIAIRRDRPPFARPSPSEGPGFGFIDPSWLAAVLWALAGGIATALVVESAVRRRSVGSVGSALLRGLPVLAAAAALAVGYFLVLGLPGPTLWETTPWRMLNLVAIVACGFWVWSRELQSHLREDPGDDSP